MSDVNELRAQLAELSETVAVLTEQVKQAIDAAANTAALVQAFRDQKPVSMPAPIVNVDIPPAPKPQVHFSMPPLPAPVAAPTSGDYDIEHEWEGARIVRSKVTRRQVRSH